MDLLVLDVQQLVSNRSAISGPGFQERQIFENTASAGLARKLSSHGGRVKFFVSEPQNELIAETENYGIDRSAGCLFSRVQRLEVFQRF